MDTDTSVQTGNIPTEAELAKQKAEEQVRRRYAIAAEQKKSYLQRLWEGLMAPAPAMTPHQKKVRAKNRKKQRVERESRRRNRRRA